jgi:hypothetical protein
VAIGRAIFLDIMSLTGLPTCSPGIGQVKGPSDSVSEATGKDGGWVTDYNEKGRPVGRANVETTALAVLALDSVMPADDQTTY